MTESIYNSPSLRVSHADLTSLLTCLRWSGQEEDTPVERQRPPLSIGNTKDACTEHQKPVARFVTRHCSLHTPKRMRSIFLCPTLGASVPPFYLIFCGLAIPRAFPLKRDRSCSMQQVFASSEGKVGNVCLWSCKSAPCLFLDTALAMSFFCWGVRGCSL